MGIRDVLGFVTSTKDARGKLLDRRAKLAAERETVANAPEHLSDKIARAVSDVDRACEMFEARLAGGWYCTPEAKTRGGNWASMPTDVLFCVLNVPVTIPSGNPLVPTAPAHAFGMQASPLALTWALADDLKRRLPALVERMHPESRDGLKADVRAAKLAKLDAELDKLDAELAELDSALADIRGNAA